MKIGIITYHRAHNYGAVLQCYALQEVLRTMGHDAWVIDYCQPYIDDRYKSVFDFLQFSKLLFKLNPKSALRLIVGHFRSRRRKLKFENFRRKYLRCTGECSLETIPQNFDCYMIGSDQVWGLHCTCGYDPVFWGQFKRPPKSKLVGYAISSNGDYKDYLSKQEIISYVNSFDYLSFREESVRDDIKSITGLTKSITLDPTLLTIQEIWSVLLNKRWKKRNYVVVYQIRVLPHNRNMIKNQAVQYAKKYGCDVIDLTSMRYSVEDFVSAIRYAKCVFTSSFHATVFSLIFGTPFFSFKLYDGHDGRYADLLKEFGLERNLVDEFSKIEQLNPSFDHHFILKKLKELQETSLRYLVDSCSKKAN